MGRECVEEGDEEVVGGVCRQVECVEGVRWTDCGDGIDC